MALIEATEQAARGRADEIRQNLDSLTSYVQRIPELVIAAYRAEDWRTLKYSSFEEYVTGEYDTHLIKLDAAVRKNWTKRFRTLGMSIDEVKAITNVSAMTVSRDARDSDDPPDPGDETSKAVKRLTKDIERVRDDIRRKGGQLDPFLIVELHHAQNLLNQIAGIGDRE